MKHRDFDVIVVGGGHAGTEAATAAARCGARTILITHRFDRLGEMSCNPAIGGLGKGHIVREIDALDGVMARAADEAGIQFRLLNRRKGPAAQGPRAQTDRALYRAAIQAAVRRQPNLTVLEGEVTDIIIETGTMSGVRIGTEAVSAPAVILTTGTFLRGTIHLGERTWPAGRHGDHASIRLAERIAELALPLGRLKTGTPPRLDGRTIDWAAVESQPGDDAPVMFSFLSTAPVCPQVACGITWTNPQTHDLIRANLHRSAMYGGRIAGAGPRYCPSIEDKVVRFGEKDGHQVFLEPEGLADHTVYPNGISTSLPEDVQEGYVRSIQGLENVRIIRPGYAIEYDYVDPRALDRRLAVKALPGLFLAGQINGTTGYEEAAGQGLLAGLNAAAHALGTPDVVLSRSDSYIGVMVDDLVNRGVTEPYRMFTSRAEHRLHLRADNADRRLTPLGIAIGCVSAARRAAYESKAAAIATGGALLLGTGLTASAAMKAGLQVNQDGAYRSAFELLGYPDATPEALAFALPALASIDAATLEALGNDARYAPYLARQAHDVERLARDEAVALPGDLDYAGCDGLSNELRGKLALVRPASLGQAARIEGMTPAALTLLLAKARAASRAAS